MHIETGTFHVRCGWVEGFRSYPARVVILREEFLRLKFAKWEKCDELTPCISWCHDNVGKSLKDWESSFQRYPTPIS